jgi:hypothetical protein
MSDQQGVFPRYSSTVQWSADDEVRELSLGLAGYLRAVAEALGVPSEGTTFEISDTATAYLAMARQWPGRPGRDLMLVWSERTGWIVQVETDPGEQPMVVARLGGRDPAPEPKTVAKFVADALALDRSHVAGPPVPMETNRAHLAEVLTRYVTSHQQSLS